MASLIDREPCVLDEQFPELLYHFVQPVSAVGYQL